MAAPVASLSARWEGAAPIDSDTPIHFLIGTIAGLGGLDPSLAAVTVIGFEALLVVLETGRLTAAFEKRMSESYGNQAIDALVAVAGVKYGEYLRSKQQVVQQTSQQYLAIPVQPTVLQDNIAPLTEVSGVSFYR